MSRLSQKDYSFWVEIGIVPWYSLKKNVKWKKLFAVFFEDRINCFKSELRKKVVMQFHIQNCHFYDTVEYLNRPCSLRVEIRKNIKSKPKVFYISSQSLQKIDEIKTLLEIANAEFNGSFGFKTRFRKNSLVLEQKELNNWKQKEVISWLKKIKYDDPLIILGFQKANITGPILSVLDLPTLIREVPNVSKDVLSKLYDEIQELKYTGRYFENRYVIRNKVKKILGTYIDYKKGAKKEREVMEIHDSNENEKVKRKEIFKTSSNENILIRRVTLLNRKDVQGIIDDLCEPSRIKHRFLSTSLDLLLKKSKDKTKFEQEEKDSILFSLSRRGSFQYANEKLLSSMLSKFDTSKIPIKIIVTETPQTSSQNAVKMLKQFISPIIHSVKPNVNDKLESFRTAIIVGPWYLEWSDSELVIPKRIVHSSAVCCIDVDTLIVKNDEVNEVTDKLSLVISKWNSKYIYSDGGESNVKGNGKGLNVGNCQDFVEDVIKTLGVKLDLGDNAYGTFLQNIKKKGKGNLLFLPSKDFKSYFDVKFKSKKFETHKELDEFAWMIRSKCYDVYETFGKEWMLLKSFDRAFWLRHFEDSENPKYKPRDFQEGESYNELIYRSGCPFSDPRETKSFIKQPKKMKELVIKEVNNEK